MRNSNNLNFMDDLSCDMPILDTDKSHGFSKKGSFATMASSRELLDLQHKKMPKMDISKYRGQRLSNMSNSNKPSESNNLNMTTIGHWRDVEPTTLFTSFDNRSVERITNSKLGRRHAQALERHKRIFKK